MSTGTANSFPNSFPEGVCATLRSPFGEGGRSAPWRLRRMPAHVLAVAAVVATLAGCSTQTSTPISVSGGAAAAAMPAGDSIAPGIVHQSVDLGDSEGMDIIDIDLPTANAHLAVAADDVSEVDGAVVGTGMQPSDWVRRGALAAVNGGYFGAEHGNYKEVVGLLVQNGRVRHAAPPMVGSGGSGLAAGRYVRSAFGIMANGEPSIVWAATETGKPQRLWAYRTATPPLAGGGRRWKPRDAIGCGPTLIADGQAVSSDRSERLVSEGPLPRTFVAYDLVAGHPRHVVIGIASGASFSDLSTLIANYYTRYHGTRAWAAMCFDGGSSTQLTYRVGGKSFSPRDTGITVADCLTIEPGRR